MRLRPLSQKQLACFQCVYTRSFKTSSKAREVRGRERGSREGAKWTGAKDDDEP